ncbi:Prohibitin family protein [Sulfidibacter corallicola]|uniref:Prohibitin family protein n=1 Tax=Sulfidibacter corallicola TaxID=2818388 RepID=A0A8A4TI16_SULCO|nr:prohibitin family protein [Sulfidibacter corallicola]QTD49263.1 prohibitin family protein [Sulfidibacter corallicola]
MKSKKDTSPQDAEPRKDEPGSEPRPDESGADPSPNEAAADTEPHAATGGGGGSDDGNGGNGSGGDGDGEEAPKPRKGRFAAARAKIAERVANARHYLLTHRREIAIGILSFILALVILWPYIFIAIHSGQAGVYYSRFFGGTRVDERYDEGTHFIWPWDKLYIYDIRIQESKQVIEALARNGLTIKVHISIRYRPIRERLGYLHKNVGPKYLTKIVVPEIEMVVRETVGHYYPEEIYSTKREPIEKIIRNSKGEVGSRYIQVDDVIVRRIELPKMIQDAIQRKLQQEQESQEYVFRLEKERQEAERKRIEARGVRDFQEIVSSGISEHLLRWKGIKATLELAKSPNSKIVVIGSGKDGLPLILNTAEMDKYLEEHVPPKKGHNPKGTPVSPTGDPLLNNDPKEENKPASEESL